MKGGLPLLFIGSIYLLTFSLFAYWVHLAYIKFFKGRKFFILPEEKELIPQKQLERAPYNPILSPQPHYDWEGGGTFNPAAWHGTDGTVHLIYRAVGSDGVSRLGYARSTDKKNFERLSYPVFVMENLRGVDQFGRTVSLRPDPVMYPSGGSWGGAEDPRMVEIGDRIYVTCSAFDGWDHIRIAVISISKEDLINQRWNWSKPLLISPKGEIHKNWMIFPEKINGKFAILHSITPKIQIDYVDELEDLARGKQRISSKFHLKHEHSDWGTWLRGPAAPPIRIKEGWLVLYHATSKQEPDKYKIGAMILDGNNPLKIIAKSPGPILGPDMWYENDWKPGVVYACGAVIEDGTLYVYYGGGDKHACVAEIPSEHLISWILEHGKISDGDVSRK